MCYPHSDMGIERVQTIAPSSAVESLVLDHLEPDPNIARRLSPSLAFRHCALPVAEGDQRLTVAMADPADSTARQAVVNALGRESCLVQGDATVIKAALYQIWSEMERLHKRVLVSVPTTRSVDGVGSYVEYVGSLLGADLDYCLGETTLDALVEKAAGDYEMVIYGASRPWTDEFLCSEGAGCRTLDRVSVPVLVAHCPRQPLRRLLLIVQGAASDHNAADWAVRLATSSGAAVTVLAVVPSVSAVYGLSRPAGGVAELLSTDTVLGRQMRHIAQRLVDMDIECTLRLRHGPPMCEIRREAVKRMYDLVVVSVAPQGGLRCWGTGQSPVSLLGLLDRPMLMAG